MVIYTLLQTSCLYMDGWINGASVERGFKHRRIWARNALFLLGIKVDAITGRLPTESGLLISNHRTLLDPIIQLAYIDAFIIAKAEVAKLPAISQGARATGIIFVKREKLKSRYAARQKTEELLNTGYNVLVYAEGTTIVTRTTGTFKIGTFAIAAANDIPIIPVAIEYPKEKDYWFEASMAKQIFGQIGSWRTRVKLHIGEPLKGSDAQHLMKTVKSEIDQNLIKMQQGWSEIFVEDKPTVS